MHFRNMRVFHIFNFRPHKVIAGMSERVQDSNLSPFEMKKIAYLSAVDSSNTQIGGSMDIRKTVTMTHSFARDDGGLAQSSKSRISQASSFSTSVMSYASEGVKSMTKYSIADGSKSGSRQLATLREKKFLPLRKEKYDWIKIDKDDPMAPPEVAPLYVRSSSEESADEEDDDIGYWRKRADKTFCIFEADGTVIQDEVTIGFKPISGEQFPPRKWTSKKVKKEMVFKKKMTPPEQAKK